MKTLLESKLFRLEQNDDTTFEIQMWSDHLGWWMLEKSKKLEEMVDLFAELVIADEELDKGVL